MIHVPQSDDRWLIVPGSAVAVGIDRDLTLNIYEGNPAVCTWQSSPLSRPTAFVRVDACDDPVVVPLGDSADRQSSEYCDDSGHRGQRSRLRGLPGVDVELELIYAVDDEGELLLQVEQTGGKDTVQRITGLYDWVLTPAPDAYVLAPRGSGYLIRADQPDAAQVEGFFGTAHSMPLFGIVRGDRSQYQIVETWWDAQLIVKHTPGQDTLLSLVWDASLGALSYARRVLIRLGQRVDHVGMAKGYRQYLIERGAFKTLKERSKTLPVLAKHLSGMEYRWPPWPKTEQDIERLRANIRGFQDAGLPISFFFPKWPARGVDHSGIIDGGWQGYIHPSPMPGGWPAAVKLLDVVHALGCTVKVMVMPHIYYDDAPAWDPAKATGLEGMPHISDHHALWMIRKVHDFITEKDFEIDAMYFDGHSAYYGHDEHQGRSRREGFEAQLAQFDETRRRGIIPGGELARAWAIPGCDYFFFTDWSDDRLRHGEPVPVFQLVFHDCYGAHFSGGGYSKEGMDFDWSEDRHPRLYELMYAAVPSHNWLPGGRREIDAADWDSDRMNRRLKWLKRWHGFYQAVCYAEMTSHQFLNDQRTLQRVEFANGVTADFDLQQGLFCVQGVEGFTGDWEKPEKVE